MGNRARSGLPRGVKNITDKIDVSKFKVYKSVSEFNQENKEVNTRFEEFAIQNGSVPSIQYYSEDGYAPINRLAREPKYANMTVQEILTDLQKRADAGEVDKDTVKDIRRIHEALNQGEVIKPFVATRSSSAALLFPTRRSYTLTDEDFSNMVGQVVRDTGFMSVSVVPKRDYLVIYKINIPAGKGIGSSIMKFSSFKTREAEFLINMGAYFKITKFERKDSRRIVYMDYIGR